MAYSFRSSASPASDLSARYDRRRRCPSDSRRLLLCRTRSTCARIEAASSATVLNHNTGVTGADLAPHVRESRVHLGENLDGNAQGFHNQRTHSANAEPERVRAGDNRPPASVACRALPDDSPAGLLHFITGGIGRRPARIDKHVGGLSEFGSRVPVLDYFNQFVGLVRAARGDN